VTPAQAPAEERTVSFSVNGRAVTLRLPVRKTLADVLREDLRLTGTHLGCEHGVCGACTILFDEEPVRACLLLGVQADGHALRTVEGLANGPELHPLQAAFRDAHGLQCGYCTPGFLMTAVAFLKRESQSHRARDPHRALGQPLPVHGLHRHPRSRGTRGAAHAWRGHAGSRGGRRLAGLGSAFRLGGGCCHAARQGAASSAMAA
jgi:carbon-monoxide dehydrogenase small subunit